MAAFAIGGIIAAPTALSISGLGTATPKAGGAYYNVNDAPGPLIGASRVGDWLGLAAAVASYLTGVGSDAAIFIPVPSFDLVVDTRTPSPVIGLLAGLFLLGVNYIGAKETGRVQIAIVLVLVAVVGAFRSSAPPGSTRAICVRVRQPKPAAGARYSRQQPRPS